MLPSPAWRRQEAVEKEMLRERSREGDCGLLIGRYPARRWDSIRQRAHAKAWKQEKSQEWLSWISNLPQILKVTVTNPHTLLSLTSIGLISLLANHCLTHCWEIIPSFLPPIIQYYNDTYKQRLAYWARSKVSRVWWLGHCSTEKSPQLLLSVLPHITAALMFLRKQQKDKLQKCRLLCQLTGKNLGSSAVPNLWVESPVSTERTLGISAYCKGNFHPGLFLTSSLISNKEEILSIWLLRVWDIKPFLFFLATDWSHCVFHINNQVWR